MSAVLGDEWRGREMSDIVRHLGDSSDALPSSLKDAHQRYLQTSISLILEKRSPLSKVGLGYIAFARFLWHLFFPSLPIDPAIGFRAQSGFVQRQLSSLRNLFAAVETADRRDGLFPRIPRDLAARRPP